MTNRVRMPSQSPAGMGPQQKVGSAMTYGERYALVAALGLTTADVDDDGASPPDDAPTITGDQFKDLNDLYLEAKPDERVFFKYFGITKLSELRTSDLEEATDICVAKLPEEKGQ